MLKKTLLRTVIRGSAVALGYFALQRYTNHLPVPTWIQYRSSHRIEESGTNWNFGRHRGIKGRHPFNIFADTMADCPTDGPGGYTLSDQERSRYLEEGGEALAKLKSLYSDTEGWKDESTCKKIGTVGRSKTYPDIGKMYRFEVELSHPKADVIAVIGDFRRLPEWNPHTVTSSLEQRVGENTVLSYSCGRDQAGGLVAKRDFVILNHSEEEGGGTWVQSSCSTEYGGKPHLKGRVRADNKRGSGWVIKDVGPDKCSVTFFLGIDMKGMIPMALVHQTIVSPFLDYMYRLDQRVNEVRGA